MSEKRHKIIKIWVAFCTKINDENIKLVSNLIQFESVGNVKECLKHILNNSKFHFVLIVKMLLSKSNIPVLECLPYSTDLAPFELNEEQQQILILKMLRFTKKSTISVEVLE